MSERGTFCMDRGWFDHPEFATDPFTEREAWAWLIAHAAYKPHSRKIGHVTVDLKRGQLAGSIRFIAEKWQWSKSRVDRFLARLKERDMIGTDSGTGVLVVTICNYSAYQPAPEVNGTPETPKPGQQRDKGEEGNNKNTPAQRAPAHTHTHEGWGQKEVPETWEPRPEVFEFIVQLWVLKGLDPPSAREKARSEVQRFRCHSRSRGRTFANLDEGLKEWATKHNAPHNRTPLTVVNGTRHAEPSSKPRTVHDAARDLELRLSNLSR